MRLAVTPWLEVAYDIAVEENTCHALPNRPAQLIPLPDQSPRQRVIGRSCRARARSPR